MTITSKKSLATLGASLVAVTAAFTLAGCLSGTDPKSEEQIAREQRLQFIAQTSEAAIAAAGIPSNAEIRKGLEALGCPNLVNLFNDMQNFQSTESQPLPKSFTDHLSCFGIKGSGTIDDIDSISAKFKNPTQLLDCICGSSALSDLLAGKLEVFNAEASRAAEVFDASSSKAATAYDPSKSKTSTVYDPSKSKPADVYKPD